LLLLVLLILAGCGPQGVEQGQQTASNAPGAEPPAAPPATGAVPIQPAPAWQDAANAAYPGVFEETIVLVNGTWEGEPYVAGGVSAPRAGLAEDFLLSGDLDGDNVDEAVVLLWSSGGGSGTFDYVAVLDRDVGGAVSVRAIAPLGDRIKVRSADIANGAVVFEVVQAGPDDAACCPGQKMRRTFVLEDETMTETSAEDQGRLSLADLAGTWRLRRFAVDETVPPEVQITAQFENSNIAGSAACNRYMGSVQEGDVPGSLSLSGPLAVTRKMCPPPLMDWERRYLAALEGLVQYSFVAGRLVLTWRKDDDAGTLLFDRMRAEETADG